MEAIADRLEEIRARVAAAAARAGRRADEIQLVAVSKRHPAERVRVAYEAGQEVFGESRVQEALVKQQELPGAIQWHFIGHLQTNKVRKAVGAFALFHGIDRMDVALAMDRIGGEEGVFPRGLIEVNVAGEATKFGFSPDEIEREIEGLLELRRLQVEGLMALPPEVAEPEDARKYFVALRELRNRLADRTGVPLSTLSMGMSGDFEVAIEEGATIVRVGTAIFGAR